VEFPPTAVRKRARSARNRRQIEKRRRLSQVAWPRDFLWERGRDFTPTSSSFSNSILNQQLGR
jgi:hypothetical protein